jgi:hypothetical protein
MCGRLSGKVADRLDVVYWGSVEPASSPAWYWQTIYPRYLCEYRGPVTIEPKYGYAIADRGRLIELSVTNSWIIRQRNLRHLFGLPSVLKYVVHRYVRRDCVTIGRAVSLMTAWPDNYFHFYNDVLPKLVLLEECAVDRTLPVLVPDALYRQPFFQQAVLRPRLHDLSFVAPRGRYLRCDSLVMCSDIYDTRNSAKFERALDLLGVARSDSDGTRRIFLTRSAERGRVLLNFVELEPVVLRHGFDVVDADNLSLDEQAELFREARYVVGIHGSGLVNIVFALGSRLDLLEVRPPGLEGLDTDFKHMCAALGFGHWEVFGESDPDRVHWHESFRVAPDALDDALGAMVDHARPEPAAPPVAGAALPKLGSTDQGR